MSDAWHIALLVISWVSFGLSVWRDRQTKRALRLMREEHARRVLTTRDRPTVPVVVRVEPDRRRWS